MKRLRYSGSSPDMGFTSPVRALALCGLHSQVRELLPLYADCRPTYPRLRSELLSPGPGSEGCVALEALNSAQALVDRAGLRQRRAQGRDLVADTAPSALPGPTPSGVLPCPPPPAEIDANTRAFV